MGVRDYKNTQLAAIVGRVCRMWEGEGIWSLWMGRRYIKGWPIDQIEKRQSDSSTWKANLRQKEHISKCATLGANGTKTWVGKGTGSSTKNVVSTLRPDNSKDELAKGVWANKIGKVALNLWRIRWGNLPTKDRLIRRGMVICGKCELCDIDQESANHLFLKCECTE